MLLTPYFRNGGMIGVTLDFNTTDRYGDTPGGTEALTYIANYVSEGGNQNPRTWTDVNFGAEAADRYIIVAIGTRNDTRTISSVTIGGVSADIVVQNQDGNTTVGIAIALVPTGVSGTVVVTLSGTADSHYLGVWSVTGLPSATPVATAQNDGGGGNAQNLIMATASGGFAIVAVCNAAGGNGPENPSTVSANLTLRFDGDSTTPLQTNGMMAGADGQSNDGTTTTFTITPGDNNNASPAVGATFEGPVVGALGNLKNSGIWDVTGVLASIISGGGGGPSHELGLTPSLLTVSGTNNAWTQQTVDISAYAGATVRLVFRYQNGSSFTGDIQLDQVDLDGNVYSFENQTHSFETSSVDNSPTYAGVSWSALTVTENLDGYWQVDQGGTPSNNTGRTDAANGSYYVYAETSAPADQAGYNFWLRSPEIVLGGSPTLTFFEARNGAGIGTLDVYLEVTA